MVATIKVIPFAVPGAVLQVAEAMARQRDARGGDPVSYTHLRAHETVLDLVCRLLLEKKKHEINNTSTYRPNNKIK